MRKRYADAFRIVYFRFLSPLLHALASVGISPAAGCRFEPTCGRYCEGALRQHGLLRGAWLSLRRVSRCHPFSKGGWDPLPSGSPVGVS